MSLPSHVPTPTALAEGTARRALLSVFDKSGLVPFAKALSAAGVELLASGGTAVALSEAGLPIVTVEAYTQAKEILGGRVKTLHPKVHGGILADRRDEDHLAQLEAVDYGTIDIVVCNLYPFEQKLAEGANHATLVETIDIGGPTLVRAAAKNADGGVTVIADPADYDAVAKAVTANGSVPSTLRRRLAATAFRLVAKYDLSIAAWAEEAATASEQDGDAETATGAVLPARLPGFVRGDTLRYGENPHQKAALYVEEEGGKGIAHGKVLTGKPLSYNNYLDMDAAWRATWLGVTSSTEHRCAVLKHTNPCGLAEATTQADAFKLALAGDPVSAFGSIIGFNHPLDGATAQAMVDAKLFVECIVAPDFSPEAREALSGKKNLRLFQATTDEPIPPLHMHRIGGGLLVQQADHGPHDAQSWRCVTKKQPEAGWVAELDFAMGATALLKSNAIALTKNRALLGAGTGQMSRVDATRHAIEKANASLDGRGIDRGGLFLGSDAFFPFDDCVRLAAGAGVVGIVQPGGSKRDQESIDACDELGLVMLFSGQRHFRH